MFAKFLPKIIRGYALDALDDNRIEPNGRDLRSDALDFVKKVGDSPTEVYSAIGLGDDARIRGNGAIGAALAVNEKLIHLCAFTNVGHPRGTGAADGRLRRITRQLQFDID